MLLLLRRKMSIGVVLILSAMIVAFLFTEDISDIPFYFFQSVTSYLTWRVLIIVFAVFLLANTLKQGDIDRMLKGVVNVFPNLKVAITIPPALIGFLPMPGGAMLPAPIVDSIGDKLRISPEQKVYITYWFRHLWEYCWPLYPGLIITASILAVEMKQLFIYQAYLTVIALIAGIIVMWRIKGTMNSKRDMHIMSAMAHLLLGIWPIILIIVLILAVPWPVEIITLGVTIIYLMTQRFTVKKKLKLFFTSFTMDAFLLIIGAMLFKDILEYSRALSMLIETFPQSSLLSIIIIVSLSFIAGFLTGINQAYVGIVLPVILPFLISAGEGVNMYKVAIFYSSGFAGVLLSPVHLCLILTKEYFKADFGKLYRMLLPSTIPILIIPVIVYLIMG